MKRTRPIRGKYWIESPRMAHEGEVISIRMKVSQVQLLVHRKLPSRSDLTHKEVGEIERGRVDGEE